MELRRDVFQAISDPTRRRIIDVIAGNSLNLNAIAEHFDISRPAISQHIKILEECGLLVIHQQGRERFCEARLAKLQEVAEWTTRYHAFWNKKLDALEKYLNQDQNKSSKKINEKRKSKPRKRRI